MLAVPMTFELANPFDGAIDINFRYYFEDPYYEPFVVKKIVISTSDLKT